MMRIVIPSKEEIQTKLPFLNMGDYKISKKVRYCLVFTTGSFIRSTA